MAARGAVLSGTDYLQSLLSNVGKSTLRISFHQKALYVTASKPLSASIKKGQQNKIPKKKQSFQRNTVNKSLQADSALPVGKFNDHIFKPAPVVNLNEFLPEIITNDVIGEVLAIPEDITRKLEKFGYPKFIGDEVSLLKKPSFVVRPETVEFIDILEEASSTPSRMSRYILTGSVGSGKSILLLQAVSFCLSRKWIVIYVPQAIDWVNSNYMYSKLPNLDEYEQPALASKILAQIQDVNKAVLESIFLSKNYHANHYNFEAANMSISKLLSVGVEDKYIAQKVLEIFLEEIGNSELSVLIAVDEINAFYATSRYNNTNSESLQSYRLSMPRALLDYFSGKKSLNKGAVVGAISNSFSSYRSFALEVALNLTTPDPYTSVPEDIVALARGIKRFEVANSYREEEAKSVLDYYRLSKVVYEEPSHSFFLHKFSTSGGNPRRFFKNIVKNI